MNLKEQFSGFVGAAKRYWLPMTLVVVAAVVFAGGTIVGFYNKVRAKVPQLPAPKV